MGIFYKGSEKLGKMVHEGSQCFYRCISDQLEVKEQQKWPEHSLVVCLQHLWLGSVQ